MKSIVVKTKAFVSVSKRPFISFLLLACVACFSSTAVAKKTVAPKKTSAAKMKTAVPTLPPQAKISAKKDANKVCPGGVCSGAIVQLSRESKPEHRAWQLGASFAPTFGITYIPTQLKAGLRLSRRLAKDQASGPSIGLEIDFSFGNAYQTIHPALKFSWDILLSERYGIYVTPFARFGVISAHNTELDITALSFDFTAGVDLKLVLDNRFYLSFRPAAFGSAFTHRNAGFKWEMGFAAGVLF